MRRALGVVLLAAACGGPVPPWPSPPKEDLALRASLERDEVALLAPVTLALDLFWRGPRTVEFAPRVPEGFRGEVQKHAPVALYDGTWQRTVLELRPVRGPGELTIPAFSARADGAEASTGALTLRVDSVLAGAGPGLEAPGDPFPAPLPWLRWSLYGAAALAAAAVLFFWLRWRRQRALAVPDEVPLPPHVKALRELARLAGAPRRTAAEVDAFYVAVSYVLRVYLEAAFGWRAPERTTEEFLQELEAGRRLDAGQRRELRAFLDQCDLVKFAAQVPDEPVHAATLGFAQRFVESTRPDRVSAQGAEPRALQGVTS